MENKQTTMMLHCNKNDPKDAFGGGA